MFRIYKTEFFQKRPQWIIPLLLEISPKNFVQPTFALAVKQLDEIAGIIRGSNVFSRKKKRYRMERGEDYVSIVSENGSPYLSYRIESFKNLKDQQDVAHG